jgi:hypothetical protein
MNVRDRGRSRPISLALSIILLLVAAVTWYSEPRVSSAASAKKASVAVVICPTKYGYSSPKPAKVPGSYRLNVHGFETKTLSIYVDKSDLLRILAPKGWFCAAKIYTDASAGLIAYPEGESPPPSDWSAGWHVDRRSTETSVSATETGASTAQAAAQACSGFSSADAVVESNFGHSCTKVPLQVVKSESRTVVQFEDPTGVDGIGMPSGGINAAIGVLTYTVPKLPGSYMATCTVPKSKSALCSVALKYFTALYAKK